MVKSGRERSPQGHTLLYRNPSDGPLRVMGAVALVFALGSAMLAGMMLDSRVHISHHISLNERAGWAGGLLVSFVGLLAATWMYSRRLATGIDLSADGQHMRVHSPTLMGTSVRDVPLGNVTRATVYEGDARGQQAMASPWVWVKVRGDRSFVVPLAGHIPNRDRLMGALHGHRPD